MEKFLVNIWNFWTSVVCSKYCTVYYIPRKSELALTEIKFLGNNISKEGLKPDDSKISAIQAFLKPKAVKEVRSLWEHSLIIGASSENFRKLAEPLLKLTRKDAERMVRIATERFSKNKRQHDYSYSIENV